MYADLLKLCAFEEDDIQRETPRIEKALEIWEIRQEDVKRAEERVKRFFELELVGIRKFLGIWMKEFIDLTLAKDEGKKVIYSAFPPISQITASMAILSEDIYAVVPETTIQVVIGQIFDKLRPLLEEAEEYWLPPGQAHCPLLQTRLAAIISGRIPMPDILMPPGVTCDQASKTDEIIQELYGVPVAHLDSCMDEDGASWPQVSPRRVRYLVQEMKNTAKTFVQVTGHEFTDETVMQGLTEYEKVRSVYLRIQALNKGDFIPLSVKDVTLISLALGTCGRRAITEGPSAGEVLLDELRHRIEYRVGPFVSGIPRVLCVLPHFSDPAVMEIIENEGLAVVVDTQTATKAQNEPSKYDSVWERAADVNLRRGSRYSTLGSVKQLKALCQEWNVDGAIINALPNCRVYQFFPLKAKEVIERELGIPVLALQLDPYDSRNYTPEIFRTSVEPFAEIVRQSKKAREYVPASKKGRG